MMSVNPNWVYTIDSRVTTTNDRYISCGSFHKILVRLSRVYRIDYVLIVVESKASDYAPFEDIQNSKENKPNHLHPRKTLKMILFSN